MSDDPVVFKNGSTVTAAGLFLDVVHDDHPIRFGRSQLESAYEYALSGRLVAELVRPVPWIERYGLTARPPKGKAKKDRDPLGDRPF